MLGTCETKRVARNTGHVASLVTSMTISTFWSFLAFLKGNMYDSSDRITFLSFLSLSTDMVMSELLVKLINGLKWHTCTSKKGKTVFIGKVTDSDRVKLQEAYTLKKQQHQQQKHWTSDDRVVCKQFQKKKNPRISELWIFLRLREFLERIGLLIPHLRYF